jgi:hypothetical protein
MEEFASLFADVGEPFTEAARRKIERATGNHNRSEVPLRRPFTTVRLDSRAKVDTWRHRLSAEDVARILEIVGPVGERFYPDWRIAGNQDSS